MIIKVLKWFLLPPVLLFMQGCLENNVIPDFHGSVDNTAEMLVYFESHGNYINSMDSPSLIDASEVYNNLGNYLIIDTRTDQQYSEGRIKGALRLDAKDIPAYFKENDTKMYSKVVLVSQAGQSSSYYTTLLRLLGYNNVYSLNFGMGAWNTAFSKIWMDNTFDSPTMKNFTNVSGKRNPMAPLPGVEFETKSNDIKDKIEERINKLFSEGFNEEFTNTSEDVAGPAITAGYLFSDGVYYQYYLVCYGSAELYEAVGLYNPYSGMGHPAGAVSYAPFSSLKGSSFLQTMPPNKKIAVYCYNGQYSASASAYLRVLGYDARTLLFGAHVLFYSRILWDPTLKKYGFVKYGATEYPFEK